MAIMDTNTIINPEEISDLAKASFSDDCPKMTLDEKDISLCSEFFTKEKYRKISAEELSFVDAFAKIYRDMPFAVSVSEFSTSSDEIARSFTDMAKKCSILSGDKGYEPSYSDLADAADRYLERCGKQQLLPQGFRISSSSKSSEPFLAEEVLINFDEDISLVRSLTLSPPLSDDDRIAYLTSKDGQALKEFIRARLSDGKIHLAAEICEGGILPSLMTIAAGFDVKLSDIEKIFLLDPEESKPLNAPMDYLSASDTPKGYLIRTSKKQVPSLVGDIKENKKTTFISIGSVAARDVYRVRNAEGVCVAEICRKLIDLLFSSNKRAYVTSAECEAMSPNKTPVKKQCTFSLNGQKYDCIIFKNDLAGGFSEGLYSVLNAVGALTEMGHSSKDIVVFTKFVFPAPSSKGEDVLCGDHLAAMAGVYRAKAALSVGGGGTCIFSDKAPSVHILAFAKCRNTPLPVEDRGDLYLLEASLIDSSIPDPENIRNMLTYINKLRAEGIINDVTFVGGKSLHSLIKEASPERDLSLINDRVMSFAFAVRSEKSIYGIRI